MKTALLKRLKCPEAECIMNHSSKAIEIEDIEARVTDLERAAEASKQPR